MFWKEYGAWPLKGARTQELKCPNCSNTTEHGVYVVPRGFQVGIAFMKRSLLGRRKYFLVCPTCGFMSKELTKEQTLAMKASP